eukprot:COSAG01_NODE_64331_length_277_cov_0.556180_1_plen_52_part_01
MLTSLGISETAACMLGPIAASSSAPVAGPRDLPSARRQSGLLIACCGSDSQP